MTPDDCPKCDKCGAPITTGFMAVFCPLKEQCALRPEGSEESVDFFREAFGVDASLSGNGGGEG